jgi:DNA polymerase-3 subunit gamma/tau
VINGTTETTTATQASSTYVVLARKWRPAQFSDIVGQTPIVRTLMNAIQNNRLHHAVLFTGSRGIGKTSIARIFSKLIRCENKTTVDGYLTSCDQCSNCREITNGSSVDVQEIDGASNNGVEAVREIRENAKYHPSSGSKKIYIIDEVHMLTTAAFNALLKTLEEPPEHVLFVFATTEAHKIPATVISRLQRFDFKRVTVTQIQARLKQISAAEKIEVEPAALHWISRSAEGSMRDALSLFDQVIAFAGNTIKVQHVRESIGLIESRTLIETLKRVFERNASLALESVSEAYAQGHDLKVFTKGLIETLHAVLLIKVGAKNLTSDQISAEEQAELEHLASLRELEEIEVIFQVLHHGLDAISRAPQPKLVLDVYLIKCSSAELLISISSASGNGSVSGRQPSTSTPATTTTATVKTAPTAQTTTAATLAPQKPIALTSPAAVTLETKSWEGFVHFVKSNRPFLGSLLEHANNLSIPTRESPDLKISFPSTDQYKKGQLETRDYQKQLTQMTQDYFWGANSGITSGIEITLQSAQERPVESIAARKDREFKTEEHNARQTVENHPLIQEARSLFGAEIQSIEFRKEASL